MTVTHTDPTARDLLRGVLLRPDDDHARLVYADWLDDHDGKVPCEVCVRKGCECPQHVPNHYAERAELIRVGCELARLRGNATRRAELVFRENQLYNDRRREWFGIRCPVCEGKGPHSTGGCAHCIGTGCVPGFAPVTVRRGFAGSVTCRMGDVFREKADTCPDCFGYATSAGCKRCLSQGVVHKWTLTPWAADVLAAHPVTRWEIVDREPDVTNPFDTSPVPAAVRSWYREDGGIATTRHEIARIVYDELPGDGRHYVGDGEKCFRDEAEARDALTHAIGRVARRLAGLEVTP